MNNAKSPLEQLRSGLGEIAFVVVPAAIGGVFFSLLGLSIGHLVFGSQFESAVTATLVMLAGVYIVVRKQLKIARGRKPNAE